MLKKKIFFPILALAIIGTAAASSGIVSAQTTGTNSIITEIAQKFNLNEADVKSVFDTHKANRQAKMKTNFEQKLTQAVTDGKITEAQKQAILTKFADLKNSKPDFQSFKNMTPEQRKAQMDQKKTDIDNWAAQNGINLQTLKEILGVPGMGRGIRMGWKKGV